MKKNHSKLLHISFFIFTFAMSKIKDNKQFKQLKIMATANFGFNAKNVTITSSNINEVYVECENGDIDDVLIDIPNKILLNMYQIILMILWIILIVI